MADATPGPFELLAGEGDFGKRYVNGADLVDRSTIAKFADDYEGWADAKLYVEIRIALPALIAAVEAAIAVGADAERSLFDDDPYLVGTKNLRALRAALASFGE